MADREEVTMVTRDGTGNRQLHQVKAATARDVDTPERKPPNVGARPAWQTGYPFGSGFTVR